MDPIEPLINAFHAGGRPRVWSLVVTIFGDAVLHRGGCIATLRLQELLERVGIEAGALRTALSRLARDAGCCGIARGATVSIALAIVARRKSQEPQSAFTPPRAVARWNNG